MRRVGLIVFVGLLAVSLLLGWQWQRHTAREKAARRLAVWEAERREDALLPALERLFDWDHADLTLVEFAALVEAKTGMKVEIDVEGIGPKWDGRLNNSQWIELQVPKGRFSTASLLRVVLEPVGLCDDPREDRIVITTLAVAEKDRPRVMVHPLPLAGDVRLKEADWRQLIAGNVQGEVKESPGALVVEATRAEQRRVRQVIDTIKKLEVPPRDAIAISPTQSEAERAICDALKKTALPLDVVEMPLRDVARALAEDNGVPIVLRASRLEEASVSRDTPVTKQISDVSLEALLRLVLKDLELTYAIRDDALVITTPEDAENPERTVAYYLGDLDPEPFKPQLFGLGQDLRDFICPDSWSISGPSPIIVTDSGWVMFTLSDEGHATAVKFFDALRRCLAEERHGRSFSADGSDEKNQALLAALNQPIELRGDGAPLKDVVTEMREKLGIPILLSLKKLEEASVSPDSPVLGKLPLAPARDQLDAILKPLQLDFVVRDEVVQITTPEDAESQLELRIYDVRHLAKGLRDGLCQQIMLTVHPQTWDHTGGPGSIHTFRGLLIVAQTWHAHEQIELLLAPLAARPTPSDQPAGDSK